MLNKRYNNTQINGTEKDMGKSALVTGSTSGIGKALTDKLAGDRYNLVLVSRDAGKLSSQSKNLTAKYSVEITVIAMDLSAQTAAQNVYEKVKALGISIDILINNAGFDEYGPFLNTDAKKELDMINLHAIFTTEMMKLYIPDMVKNGFGRILNLGSTASFFACPYNAVYAATKTYILSLSRGVNAELKGTGVSVTTLCPGATETEFAPKAGMEATFLFRHMVLKPEKAADVGYRALMKGKAFVVAGWYNKVLVQSSRFIPSAFSVFMTKKMLK